MRQQWIHISYRHRRISNQQPKPHAGPNALVIGDPPQQTDIAIDRISCELSYSVHVQPVDEMLFSRIVFLVDVALEGLEMFRFSRGIAAHRRFTSRRASFAEKLAFVPTFSSSERGRGMAKYLSRYLSTMMTCFVRSGFWDGEGPQSDMGAL